MAAHLHKNLSKEVDYHHELDCYKESYLTKRIQKQEIKRTASFRSRSLSHQHKRTTSGKLSGVYNKWYINPEHHFTAQQKNPKNNKNMLSDEQHVYKNLRNNDFWNWVHPFEAKVSQIQAEQNLDKIDPKIIEGFKKYIEENPNKKRLPSIVQHILSKKNSLKSEVR